MSINRKFRICPFWNVQNGLMRWLQLLHWLTLRLLHHLILLFNQDFIFSFVLLDYGSLFFCLFLKSIMISSRHFLESHIILFCRLYQLIKTSLNQIISLLSRLHIISPKYLLPPFLVKVVQCTIRLPYLYLLDFFYFLIG